MGISRRRFLQGSCASAALAAVGILAACGGGSATTTTTVAAATSASAAATSAAAATTQAATTASASAAAIPAGATQLSVSVWGDVSDLQINNGIIGAFQKNNPKIVVAPQQWVGNYYQKLQIGVAGGTVPDMVYFQGWMWQTYAANGQIIDIDSYIDRDKSQLPSDLYPSVDAYARQLSFKGKHYGVPVDTGSMVMYYNKDLFQAANVPVPQPGWTHDDFLSTLQKVQDGLNKAGKKNVFAYQPNYANDYTRNFAWWRMNGGSEFDQLENPKKAQWDQPQIAAAWQEELFDFAKKGLAISQAALISGGGSSAFYTYGIQNGLAAMKVEGPWFLPQMWGPQAATKGGLNFDVVHLPKGANGYSAFWQVEPITIWKTSKHADDAWTYLKFAASSDGQLFVAQGGRMTNTPTSIEKQWAPIAQKQYNIQNAQQFAISDGASMVETGGITTDQFALKGGLHDARDAVINGSKTAQAALAGAQTSCQSILDAFWRDNPNG